MSFRRTYPLFKTLARPAVASVLLTASLFGLSATLTARPAHAAGAETATLASQLEAVERAVDARRMELHVPGASLVIVKDDKIVYIKGLGLRDIANHLPVTPETQFAIGSSTKAFTAMTVMMSADEEKLALTDSPKKYLPYFHLKDPDADKNITISDLLSHRSGLSRTDLGWYTGKLSSKEAIRMAGEARPTAKLGEKFQYQNVMFLVAGEIVGKVQKAAWTDVVARRIFKPLGMKTTNTSIAAMVTLPDYATGYNLPAPGQSVATLAPYRDLPSIAPAGAINSNAREMAQWVRLMLGGGVFEGKRLVSEQSFRELTVPRINMGGKNGYGYGWFLHDWNGHQVVEHGGNIDGFNAQVALMPDQKLGFVLLTNVSASPLGSYTMTTVWENMVGPKRPASARTATATAAAPVPPAREVGKYTLAVAKMTFEVAMKDNRLSLSVPGQPTYPLEPVGGRRYKFGSPAPEGFFVTFRPSAKDPNTSEFLLEQPQGNVVCTRTEEAAYTAPITVEELMKKQVEALGGEANLRKHKTTRLLYTSTLDDQGLTAQGVHYYRAPNAFTETETLYAVGRKVAVTRSYFDGKQGGDDVSFAASSRKSGADLVNASIGATLYPALDWKTLFKTVVIKGVTKVGDEEAYEVEMTPDKGSPVTDYISTKSFLILKQDTPGGVSTVYSDYRNVGGIQQPFAYVSTNPNGGTITVTVKEVRYDVSCPDALFKPTAPFSEAGFQGTRNALYR